MAEGEGSHKGGACVCRVTMHAKGGGGAVRTHLVERHDHRAAALLAGGLREYRTILDQHRSAVFGVCHAYINISSAPFPKPWLTGCS